MNRRHFATAVAFGTSTLHAETMRLASTETRVFTSTRLARSYPVHLGWPQGAGQGSSLPVVVVLDGDSAFPWLHGISDFMRRHAQGRGLADFLLVGLGYAQGEPAVLSRRRDYTPWVPARPPTGTSAQDFGGASAYADHLELELLPWLARTAGARIDQPTLLGHSYGGLLACWLGMHRPAQFPNLVASSPSLWLDHRRLPRETEALKRWTGPRRLFLGVGGLERVRKGDDRYNQNDDMVADMEDFARRLRRLGQSADRLRSRVQEHEDHATAMLGNYTQGLRWIFPRR